MSTLDDAFEAKWKHPTMDMPNTGDKFAARWWFAAGAEAGKKEERDAVLAIAVEVRFQQESFSKAAEAAFDIERRIRERGEFAVAEALREAAKRAESTADVPVTPPSDPPARRG